MEPQPVKPKISKRARPWGKPLPADPFDMESLEADIVIAEEVEKGISRPDHFLRAFRYSKALDAALTPYNQKRKPEMIVALLQELIRSVLFMLYLFGSLIIMKPQNNILRESSNSKLSTIKNITL
jgi:hypothetical protein